MRLFLVCIAFSCGFFVCRGQFSEGFIIDKYGQKYPGFINYVKGESLFYKESKGSKREELTIHDVKAFVVEKDSFVTIQKLKLTSSKKPISGFAKVLIRRPERLLSEISGYTTSHTTATVAEWERVHYLIHSGTKLYEMTRQNFMKEILPMIENHTVLKQKIQSKELGFNDMDKILSMYASRKKEQ